jgi:hypothetical protein
VIQLASRENLTMTPTTIAYRKASGGEKALIPRPLTKREREVAEPLAVKLISSPASEISYALGLRETEPPKPLS